MKALSVACTFGLVVSAFGGALTTNFGVNDGFGGYQSYHAPVSQVNTISAPGFVKTIASPALSTSYTKVSTAPAAATIAYAAPAAVQKTISYNTPGSVVTYSAPSVQKTISYGAPIVQKSIYAAPAPVISYAAPAVQKTISYTAPAATIAYAAPASTLTYTAAPATTISYAAAPAVQKTISYAAPTVQKTISYAAPAATISYAAPAVQKTIAYAAPAVQYQLSNPGFTKTIQTPYYSTVASSQALPQAQKQIDIAHHF
ncbi:cuticle protein 16.5-like [Varroa jacobsoni]|uniref:Uncharacterized protein n=1 Tax=Varroa destructor TaxID=109461 RepID=A0A7M7JRG6_VARDE|nr:cuticle protein 38-like [Varroa destructor]XP_022706388.1 cuticle protein 16.5-like [Varroa jacobsoni]